MNTLDNSQHNKNEYKIDPMLVTYVGDEIGWWELLGEI